MTAHLNHEHRARLVQLRDYGVKFSKFSIAYQKTFEWHFRKIRRAGRQFLIAVRKVFTRDKSLIGQLEDQLDMRRAVIKSFSIPVLIAACKPKESLDSLWAEWGGKTIYEPGNIDRGKGQIFEYVVIGVAISDGKRGLVCSDYIKPNTVIDDWWAGFVELENAYLTKEAAELSMPNVRFDE